MLVERVLGIYTVCYFNYTLAYCGNILLHHGVCSGWCMEATQGVYVFVNPQCVVALLCKADSTTNQESLNPTHRQ